MNKCPIPEQLLEWLDRKSIAGEIGKHLAACGSCRAKIAGLRSMRSCVASSPGSGRKGCPDPADVSVLADNGPAGREKDKALRHIADCASCRRELVEFRKLMKERETAGLPAKLRRRLMAFGPGPRLSLWIAAAAAVLLVAAAAALLLKGAGETPAPQPVTAEKPPEPELPEPPKPAPPPKVKEPEPVPEPEVVEPEPAPKIEIERPVEPGKKPEIVPEEKPEPPAVKPEPPAKKEERPTVPEPPKPRTRPGKFFVAYGRGSFSTDKGTSFASLKAGSEASFGESCVLRTSRGEQMRVWFGDDLVLVNGGTQLSVSHAENGTTATLSKGETFFDIAKRDTTFAVATPQGRVNVLGTRLYVSSEGNRTEVAVIHGNVNFAAAGESRALAKNERSAAEAGKTPSQTKSFNPARYGTWRNRLEETIYVEAEEMSVLGVLRPLRASGASSGAALGVQPGKHPGQDDSAKARRKVKQDEKYVLWVRARSTGHGKAHFRVEAGGHAGNLEPGDPKAWQWIRFAACSHEKQYIEVKLSAVAGGVLVDRLLLTTDRHFVPEN